MKIGATFGMYFLALAALRWLICIAKTIAKAIADCRPVWDCKWEWVVAT